jgi:hypothetical protein
MIAAFAEAARRGLPPPLSAVNRGIDGDRLIEQMKAELESLEAKALVQAFEARVHKRGGSAQRSRGQSEKAALVPKP